MQRYFEINEGGHNVRCKLYYQDLKSIRRCVIFGHGFSGHKDNAAAEKFAQRMLTKYKGCAMVTFNWPAHGDDVKKKPSLVDCDSYLTLVIRHVREKLGAEELYSYATSFGGYLMLKYIAEHGNPFRKIALRAPAVNMYDALTGAIMAPDDWTKLEKSKDITVGFDRKILIGQSFLDELKTNDIRKLDFLDYAEDILILQGTADDTIPYEEVHAFAENQLIEFISVEGACHRFRNPNHMEFAIKTILEFFAL